MGATNQPRSISPLVYSGIALSLYLLLWLMPVLGIFLVTWSPLSLILLYWQQGVKPGRKGILVAFTAAIVVFSIVGIPFAGFLFICPLILALVLGEAPAWRLKPDLAMGTAALIATLAFFGSFGFYSVIFEVGLSELWQDFTVANQEAIRLTALEMGLSEEEASQMRQMVTETLNIMANLSLAILLVGFLFTAWLNLVLGRGFLKRIYGPDEITDLGLTRWSAPEHLIWLLIASGLGVAFTGGFWYWFSLNLLTILGTLYFFHGLAVMVFLMDKRKVPIFMRVVVFVVLAAQVFLALTVALAGVFDNWFDFRKLKAAESAE